MEHSILTFAGILMVACPAYAEDPESVVTTASHRFFVLETCRDDSDDGRWVTADVLRVGDCLALADGQRAIVRDTQSVAREASSIADPFQDTTYNFAVADFHTYFVGDAGVWVHNDCGVSQPTTADELAGLVRKNYPLVRNYIAKTLKRRGVPRYRQEVDDLTHEVMIRVLGMENPPRNRKGIRTVAYRRIQEWANAKPTTAHARRRMHDRQSMDLDTVVDFEPGLTDNIVPIRLKEVIPDTMDTLRGFEMRHDIDVLLMAENRFKKMLKKPEDREMFALYFGFDPDGPLNYAEIGRKYGLTREYIRVKLKGIPKKLEQVTQARGLEEYIH